jgi:putative flippase GtrA
VTSTEVGRNRSHLQKLFRYGALSVLFTAISFTALAILVGVLNFPAGWSNFLVVAACIPVNFELNRRWVWAETDRRWAHSPKVIPFAVFSFLALALSTLAVHETGLAVSSWNHVDRAVAVDCADLGTFGSLWLIQYFFLDQILFRTVRSVAS